MKKLIFFALPSVLAMTSHAGLSAVPSDAGSSAYSIAERGAHHRIWQRVTLEKNSFGKVRSRTNSYTELETGTHFKNENGEWRESKAEIKLDPRGAVAEQGRHKVIFAPNINTAGAIDLTTSDGRRLRSHVLGLSYFDTATGQSVLIAEVKDSIGQILPPNQIIYPDAFTDFQADIRYTYAKAKFEQDIIFRQQPPSPQEYGLNPETTRLQVLTEFLNPPVPEKEREIIENIQVDKVLDFGEMKIGAGKAFAEGENQKSIRVDKHWQKLEGRDFLIEEVKTKSIEPQLNALPEPPQAAIRPKAVADSIRHLVSNKRLLPEKKVAKVSTTNLIQVASLPAKQDGFVIDYTLLSSDTDYVFKGDTTYYVSGDVVLDGTTVLEGGSVVKFASGTAPKITLGEIQCRTASYRPVIFTSKDDNSVGEIISGSTGTPGTNYYGGGIYLTANGSSITNARFSHVDTALSMDGEGYVQNGSNLQFVKCKTAIYLHPGDAGMTANLNNVLFYSVDKVIDADSLEAVLRMSHITANECGMFNYAKDASFFLTNSLLVAVSTFSGNSYYPIVSDHVVTLANGAGVFQSLGGGAHYLAANSPYRNAGATNLSAGLLADLKKKTTYPPVLLLSASGSFDSMILAPRASRDSDIPDLGYHYSPLDYIMGPGLIGDLVLTNGVCVAFFEAAVSPSSVISIGTAEQPNHLVWYNTVQEQFYPTWVTSGMGAILQNYDIFAYMSLNFSFTELSTLASSGTALIYTEYQMGDFTFAHCQFHGGNLFFSSPYNEENHDTILSFNNCLFNRTATFIAQGGGVPLFFSATGNSINGGAWFSVNDAPHENSSLFYRNNLFVKTDIYNDGLNVTADHNGYLTNEDRVSIGTGDVVISNFNFIAGPLGFFYYSATNLINKGSANADLLGLYHFTATTNFVNGAQVREANSIVDIGFHYVALGTDGLPLDLGKNGNPDYLEDKNGNGVVDAGESDFIPPTITITAPLNAASFGIARVNVSGTFVESAIKRITVNGVLAFISGSTFQALNVSLESGANIITATAEDLNGNTAAATITITATPDGSGNLIDPVQLVATPIGGFAPLTVTLTPAATVPGTLQQVQYDFNGDGILDQTESGLSPITHVYSTAGEYFPVITVQTEAGKFSSLGGWNADFLSGERLRINIQMPPVQLDSFTVTDPVDLKWINGSLYVLSRSAASITQYDAAGTPVRSITGIGSAPRGLDVDNAGNVYVAMTGNNQVWKFTPTTTSFQADTTFNTTGHIGSAGTGAGQLNAPFDVAVTPDGEEIAVSDSGNDRIQRFTKTGVFIDSFGQSGAGSGQFSTPRGLTYDLIGTLYIVDSGNTRVAFARSSAVLGTSGASGTALGQFQGAINLVVGSRGIYVADTDNNRVQKFDPTSSGSESFNALLALSSELGLNQPNAVASVANLLEERIYVADTGNNRVILVKLPATGDPKGIWDAMALSLIAGNIEAGVFHFSSEMADRHRTAFLLIGNTKLAQMMNEVGAITPVYINTDTAQYRFQQQIDGLNLTFLIEFIKENGLWKIMEY